MGMSAYDDNEYDDLHYEICKFLKTHNVSELLKIVQYAVESQEGEFE